MKKARGYPAQAKRAIYALREKSCRRKCIPICIVLAARAKSDEIIRFWDAKMEAALCSLLLPDVIWRRKLEAEKKWK